MKNLIIIITLLFSLNSFSKSVVVKFGTVAPAGTPWADTLEEIKKRVGKESNKEIKVKVFLGGQLGGELEILNGIRRGRIQGGGLTSAALGSVIPEMNVLEIPFIFDSYEEADFILDNYLVEPFTKIFEEKGLVFVSWAENGWRNIGLNSKIVKKVNDLEGIKIRSQESKSHLAFWKKIKANAIPIAVPEVLSALQTGMVEGFDNTALFTLAAEWHTGIKFYTVTKHIYQPAAVIYSSRFWKKLKDEEYKKILIGEGNKMAAPSRASVRALEKDLISALKDSGIKVYKLSKSERDAFKNSVKGLEKEIVSSLGGKSQMIYDLILKGRKKFREKGR